MRTGLRRARRFTYVFCFTDDLAVRNDGGEFKRSYEDI